MRAMSKHHQGEAAHPVLHKDVLRLARVALRCRGAAGQGQLKLTGRTIQDAAVFSTSCGTRLWSMARKPTSAAAAMVLDMARSHCKRFSDASLLLVAYTGLLLEELSRQDAANAQVLQVWPSLRKAVHEFFRKSDACRSRPMEWSSLQPAIQLVSAMLGSKPLCNLALREAQFLTTLIVRVFLATFEAEAALVRYVDVIGPPLDSKVVDNGIFLPVSASSLHQVELSLVGAAGCIRVALFDTSIGVSDASRKGLEGVLVTATSGSAAWSCSAVHVAALEDLGRTLVAHKVGMLACQKLVHPWLKRYLRARNVCCLERLSIRHIGALRCVSGAVVVSVWRQNKYNIDMFGLVTRPVVERLGSKFFLRVCSAPQSDSSRVRSVTTFVLVNRGPEALAEAKTVVKACLHVLQSLLSVPSIVPGAGATELSLARYVEMHVPGPVGLSAATALRWLVHGTYAGVSTIAATFRKCNKCSVGWDPLAQAPVRAVDCPTCGRASSSSPPQLEALVPKEAALISALNLVEALVRLRGAACS